VTDEPQIFVLLFPDPEWFVVEECGLPLNALKRIGRVSGKP
jgi:hypothetical protein